MIVMTFDLSSTCIGVTFAQINDDKKITYGQTLAIIPKKLDPREYGFTTLAPKQIASGGKNFKGYLKPDEFSISHQEAKNRSAYLKTQMHSFLLRDIAKQCGLYLNKIKPDVVCIERNSSFGGVLTTKLLAEIAGGIYFYCGATNTKMFDYHEATVRARIRKDITEFSYVSELNGMQAIDTKWEIYCRLRAYFQKEYPLLFDFVKMTMDESDSLAVFYYYYVTEVLKNDN